MRPQGKILPVWFTPLIFVRLLLEVHVGCNAYENYVFCSCPPEIYKPPQQALSSHISRGYTAQQNSQPVIMSLSCRFGESSVLTPGGSWRFFRSQAMSSVDTQ